MAEIHPTALINPKAELYDDVKIGPFTIVEADVVVGKGTVIGSNVVIADGARIGNDCKIFNGAVIATDPQDLKYKNEKTYIEIGDNTIVREYCTLNRGTADHLKTEIGKNCLLMAYVHVAHDCVIQDRVILANAVNMAGHILIEEYVGVGGMDPIHQFVRIGKHAFVGGGYRVDKDIPPYILAVGEPLTFGGLNSVGLRRRGFTPEVMSDLKKAYKLIYRSKLNTSQALTRIEEEMEMGPEVQHVVNFIRGSERGIIR
ncbi:acyl-ACP--UDP-N-acetylglucosamine O-acyltransferase [candidate division KSB1 bacterium]|nr:acyl-ACP--UDP-N-acetylglucosamine O-acyltransferase [candidate division KSB1 bacterium]